MFPSLPQPPSFSSTFLRLIDRHDCLLASSKCPRLVSLTLSRDSRDECGQSTIPWGNHSEQKHSSICQCKRTQGVLKRQRDVKDAVVWKIKIRGGKKKKSLCWNIKWRRAEYSMLVTFDSFNDFFAILCSVVRKVNCPMMIATSSGFVSHVLKTKEKKKSLKSPCPSTTDGWSKPPHCRPCERASGSQGKWKAFQYQTQTQKQSLSFLSERVRRLPLSLEAAEVWRVQ